MIATRVADLGWRAIAAAALLTLAVVAWINVPATWPDPLARLPAQSWAAALVVVIIALAARGIAADRLSLQRERRLVEAGVALRLAKARVEEMARTDIATGLLNRRAFFALYGPEFRRSLRYARPFSLLMIDIDRFKALNDGHGHQFGDVVLAGTAAALRANLRESDIVARYGGEEFVVMLAETTRAEALIVAEKLRAGVEVLRYMSEYGEAACTISVGVASLPWPGVTNDNELLRRADMALYAAKDAGRNCVEVAGAPLIVAS